MRVGMTTGSLSRDAGGLFESVRSLGKNLAELGADVRVYGLQDKHWEEDAQKWQPISAEAFPYFGPRAMAYSPKMDAALDATSSDMLHLHGLWQYPSVATRRQWELKKTPYLISPRGMLDKWALANSRWKKRIAAWLFENAVMRDAACMHALCEAEADAIRAYGLKQRIEVVPNGVELAEMGNGKWETGNASERKRLLFLGRIHPKKGLVGLLKAWAEIQNPKSGIQNSREWQLVIAGWDQGGHEGELIELCSELGLKVVQRSKHVPCSATAHEAEGADVVFYGPAFGGEKDQLLRGADAFVLPSFSEGLPMSVLEAWAYGLPVVMTPECNLPEGFAAQAALEIRNGEMGNAKWDGLQALLDMSDSDRIEMGGRGRRLVEQKFTWPKVASQMKALYEDILSRG
ncbi:MAG: glycosyltransferase [Terrimicrobiaceae bacterium]